MWCVRRTRRLRRGVGRVRHFDARLLWLQQLCAEGVVQVRAEPGEHNEADLGTKMVDLRRMTSLLKGTPLRPPMGWSSWMVAATLTAVAEAAKDCRVLIWNVRNMCETSGWFWICEGMVIVILTVLSGGPFANPIGQMTEVGRRRPTRMLRNYVQWKMSSSIMRRCPDRDSVWNFFACDAELRIRDLQESSGRQARSILSV